MKAGFVALLGRPNAGKSTLLNALLSKKVSIVSPKSQTTRDDILGIYNEKDLQIVYVDTPGLFEGEEALYKTMLRSAKRSLSDVDALCYLIDASHDDYEKDDAFLKTLKTEKPKFLLFNKIDLATAPQMEAIKAHFKEAYPEYGQIEISALKNFGLKDVKEALRAILPENPPYFPPEMVTDKDRPFMAKEVIRESLLHFLKEEVPHNTAVKIDSFEEKDGISIEATIYCAKPNQKAIIIGKGGDMIKKISMRSRHELETLWKKHVALYCQVEVLRDWWRDPKKLETLGYGSKKQGD